MTAPLKAKSAIHLGYRPPKTALEQRFWDSYSPDYRAWALKILTIDEATALAMGLDPSCLDFLESEGATTIARFQATRACISEILDGEGVLDLVGLWLFGGQYDLRLDRRLMNVALFESEGLLDRDKQVAQIESKNADLRQDIKQLNETIVRYARQKNVTPVLSGAKNAESNSAKIIVALAASLYEDESKRDTDFSKIKNGGRSNAVSLVKHRLELLGWAMDEATILQRLRAGLKDWKSAIAD